MGRTEPGSLDLRLRAWSVPLLALLVAAGVGAGAEGGRPQALLRDLVGKDAPARAGARKRLMELAGSDVPTVSKLFKSAETGAAERLARILGWTRDPRYVQVLLERAKASRDAGLKGACIIALGTIGDKNALSALRGFAGDGDPAVRLRTVEALRASDQPYAGEAILHQTCADADEAVRQGSYAAVAEIGGTKTAQFLGQQLGSGDEEHVLLATVAAGKLLARHRSTPVWKKGDAGPFEPGWAAPDMRRLTQRLIDLVERGPGPLRAAAIRALKEADRIEAVPALVAIVREEPEDAALANEALVAITGSTLPPDADAWGAVERSIARDEGGIDFDVEFDVEPDEGGTVLAVAPPAGGLSLGPPQPEGSWWPYVAVACGIAAAAALGLVRLAQVRGAAKEMDARRLKVRDGSW